MGTFVVGFKAPDAKWQAMEAIWNACQAAGVSIPMEVDRYFEGYSPDERGVEIRLEGTDCCREWHDDSRSGYEVDLRAIPKDVTHVRFYNYW